MKVSIDLFPYLLSFDDALIALAIKISSLRQEFKGLQPFWLKSFFLPFLRHFTYTRFLHFNTINDVF
jgi:hypothetical protein